MPVNQTDPKLDDGDDELTNPTENEVDDTTEHSDSDDPA